MSWLQITYQLSSNTAHQYSHRLAWIPPTSGLSSSILYHLRPIAPIERTNQAVWCTMVIICMRVPKIMQLPLNSCTLHWTVWSRIWSVTRRSACYSQIPLKCIDSRTLESYLLIDSEEEWEYYHHLHVPQWSILPSSLRCIQHWHTYNHLRLLSCGSLVSEQIDKGRRYC